MSVEFEKEFNKLVDGLVELIKKTVTEVKKSNQLKPHKTEIKKGILGDFEYTDQGIKNNGASCETITKEDWTYTEMTISDVIEAQDTYKELGPQGRAGKTL